MTSQTQQLRRMAWMIDLLRSRPYRAVELASVLDISKQTVLRILSAIHEADLGWAQLTHADKREPRGRSFERYYSIK